MKKQEESLQIALSKYLQLKYPDVIFTSESSGIRLTIGQAVKAKKMRANCKLPDLIILEPKGKYAGMALELKKFGEKVFKKNGEPLAGHVAEQWQTVERLRRKGYYSTFAIGLDHAIGMIDLYMKGLV